MTEAQKKQKELQKVSEALNTFKALADKLRALSGLYVEWIDQAAKNGEDEYSNQLIEEKVENDEIVDDLDSLYRQIMQQATLAAVLGELSSLPAALKACKGLLSASPNFKKIGKSMKSFRSGLDKARLSLHEMRQELRGKAKSTYNPDFFANLANTGAEVAADPKHKQRLENEKAARDARLAVGAMAGMVVAPVNTAPATAEQVVGASGGATDVDEIIAAMEKEKKKG